MVRSKRSLAGRLVSKVANRTTRAIPVRPVHIRLRTPIVSITFDDFARSAWLEGGRIVEHYGGLATFYAAGGLSGQIEDGSLCFSAEDLVSLTNSGHDIGCHTYDHVPVTNLTNREIDANLEKNRSFIAEITGKSTLTSFAYPYGLTSVRTKRLLSERFRACRGIYPGVNSGWTDLAQLNALCLHLEGLPLERYIEKALRHSGWLILVAHAITGGRTECGIEASVLENALKLVSAAGFEILSVEAALNKIVPAAQANAA